MKSISNRIGFSMGTAHSIFSSSNGQLYGIGKNSWGQLGIGNSVRETSTPVPIELDNVMMFDCGREFSVFINIDGDVYVCGHHTFLTGDWITSYTPVKIAENCIGCTTNGETLFLLTNIGSVTAAGPNYYYEMGRNERTNRWSLTNCPRLTEIRDISSGLFNTIVVKTNNTVYGCGLNANGELGVGDVVAKTTPQVINLTGVVGISTFNTHSLFLKSDGTVYATGKNTYGQLGLNNTTDQTTPTKITAITGVSQIAVGYDHSVFLKSDGTVYACGCNTEGQLGDGTNTNRQVPTLMPGVQNVLGIYAGYYFTALLTAEGLSFVGYVPFN